MIGQLKNPYFLGVSNGNLKYHKYNHNKTNLERFIKFNNSLRG